MMNVMVVMKIVGDLLQVDSSYCAAILLSKYL
jgi:hypothetical protein